MPITTPRVLRSACAVLVTTALVGCTPTGPAAPSAPPSGPAGPSSSAPPTNTEPSSSAAPERSVTTANLIGPRVIPTFGKERYAETIETGGRDDLRITVCVPAEGVGELAASGVLSRNFRLDRRADGSTNPGTKPTVLTQAMQFDSAAAAQQAYGTYKKWLLACPATIKATGGKVLADGKAHWYKVTTKPAGSAGGFSEVVYRAKGDNSDNGYFESTGLALVGDRLAVSVSLLYGMDFNTSYDELPDPDLDLPKHPQFALVAAGATALAK